MIMVLVYLGSSEISTFKRNYTAHLIEYSGNVRNVTTKITTEVLFKEIEAIITVELKKKGASEGVMTCGILNGMRF